MRRPTSVFVAIVIGAAVAAACSPGDRCADVSMPGTVIQLPGIDLEVRDVFGRGEAIGTTVVARRGKEEPARVDVEDTLHVLTAFNYSGRFTVTVSQPYYRDVTLQNVVVTPRGCVVETTKVAVTLELLPDAPPVRALVLIGGEFLGAPGKQVRLIPHFDANPGVSTAVTWSMPDTTLARVDASGLVTAKCSLSGGTAKVTATSVADQTVSATATLGVAPATTCP